MSLLYRLLDEVVEPEGCARELTWICEHWDRVAEADALRFSYWSARWRAAGALLKSWTVCAGEARPHLPTSGPAIIHQAAQLRNPFRFFARSRPPAVRGRSQSIAEWKRSRARIPVARSSTLLP